MLRIAVALFLLAALGVVRAQTPIALYESFAGNVNFAGTQKTIRTGSNQTSPCAVTNQSSWVTSTLSGIPAGSTILRAHLYWAGSGAAADYSVAMEGRVSATVNAAANRRYTATANGYSYFGGAADVTSLIHAGGNGTYRFRRLTVDTQSSLCQVQGVTGGFALLVIYSNPNQTFRVLNVYEGFQPTYYSNVVLSLSNFRIPNPIGTATGRIGHITWEGDSTLGNTNAENLFFNEVEMFDANNPRYNQFNSSSNINNDTLSYGIDFDAYTVASPVIQSGQTVATTRYQSGQDLVLLHSEVVAVPNVPVSDLSISMAVANAVMTQGIANTYTITVANNGPNSEPGPIVVSDTVPSELTINSVSGTGWTCTVNGQVVSCQRPGPIASGTTLSPITLSVTPNVEPSVIENTATVAGQNFDNNTENSSATVMTGSAAGDYVFTNGACVPDLAFSNSAQTCSLYTFGPHAAGTTLTNIYITALSSSGVPKRLHNNQNVTVNFYFGLSCVNPTSTASVVPVFTARTMTTCAPSGTKPVGTANTAIVFTKGTASSSIGYSFSYNDVGRVELYMVDSSGATGSSGQFVVKPASIAVINIATATRSNPVNATASATGPIFAAAGEPFSLTLVSRATNGAATPNFGRETPLTKASFKLDVAVATDVDTSLPFADMQNMPVAVLGNPTLSAITGGAANGTNYTFAEVGTIRLTPGVLNDNYLGATGIPGLAVNVGRFYPHHFDTSVEAPMPICMTAMQCPADSGAAYSGQPFSVQVTARTATDGIAQNYRGKFARAVTLSTWAANGGATASGPAGSTFTNGSIAATAFTDGTATVVTPTYTFPASSAFSYSAPRATGSWVAPTTIYLRAQETSGDGVTSNQGAASEEDAIRIVAGRLQVANAYGSDLLNLPVPVNAQYWTGGATGRWENNTSDSASVVTPTPGNLVFSSCTGSLASACTLAPLSTAAFALANGAGVVRFAAPGGGAGSALLRVNLPAWLPSTQGRVTFGQKKSPVHYIREVY